MRTLAAIILALALPGCAAVGAFSKTEEFQTTDAVQINRKPTNFVDQASEVATNLHYKVSAIDRMNNSVSMSSGVGGAGTMLIGKVTLRTFKLTLLPSGREINIELVATGNLSSGDQDTSTRKLNELKQALLEKFR